MLQLSEVRGVRLLTVPYFEMFAILFLVWYCIQSATTGLRRTLLKLVEHFGFNYARGRVK